MKQKLTLILLAGLTGLLIGAAALFAESQPAKPDLTLFYTNDVWGYVEPCG